MMSQRKSLATGSGELSENLHRLDIELARELCQNICSLFGLVFIIPVFFSKKPWKEVHFTVG